LPIQSPYYAVLGEPFEEMPMCEFNVIMNGKSQMRDVVYARVEGGNVFVKTVLGETKEFKGCTIIEVDVNAAKLVLAATKS
jgi:predicted RNA-binding protein